MNQTANSSVSSGEILVVDDGLATLMILTDLLTSDGYRVRSFDDPRLALESALSDPPDLILLDIKMPGMSGFEVCRRLKQDRRASQVPVLFVSGLNDLDDQVRGFEIGGVDYICKPIRAEEVLARVSTHLALSQKARELERAKDAAETASRAKTEFLSIMSHELRTPMIAIMGFSELMLMTGLDPKQRNYIEKVLVAAQTLLGLIDRIIEFSNLDAGEIKLMEASLQIRILMDNLAREIGPEAEKKGLELTFSVYHRVPAILIGDQRRLERILTNLGNNAVKFNEPGGKVQIAVILKDEDQESALLHFSFRDTGIGIASEQQKKLFQAFTQLDGSSTRRHGGMGLGLMLSKKLVEAMGGEIWMESELDIGSTFHFTVRLKKQLEPD